jgi:hypothetical protein
LTDFLWGGSLTGYLGQCQSTVIGDAERSDETLQAANDTDQLAM